MDSYVFSHSWEDDDGNPSGGTAFGPGFAIGWQRGPLGRGCDRMEPNGAFVEDVIQASIDRLEFYQDSKFNCRENHDAIDFLKSAKEALEHRTRRREEGGVEGTHEGT